MGVDELTGLLSKLSSDDLGAVLEAALVMPQQRVLLNATITEQKVPQTATRLAPAALFAPAATRTRGPFCSRRDSHPRPFGARLPR
eukprot:2203108-Prymnesium_polylepis.1